MALEEQELSEDLLWADDGAASSGSDDAASSEEPEQPPNRSADESSSRKHKSLDIAGMYVCMHWHLHLLPM